MPYAPECRDTDGDGDCHICRSGLWSCPRHNSPRGTSHTTSAGGNPPAANLASRVLARVIVARARDLAGRWNALADRVEPLS